MGKGLMVLFAENILQLWFFTHGSYCRIKGFTPKSPGGVCVCEGCCLFLLLLQAQVGW